MEYRKIIVDVPRPTRTAHHAESARQAQSVVERTARRAVSCARVGRQRSDHLGDDHPRRGRVFLGRLRLEVERRGRPAVPHVGRTRQLAAPRRRRVLPNVGPRQTGDRAGARLLPGRRNGTRDRMRSRLRRRGREDRLSGGARDQPSGQPVLPVDRRSAPRDGTDADGRLDVGARCGGMRLREPCVSRSQSSRRACSTSPNGLRKCRRTSNRSTSARCIGRWTRWAFVREFEPAPRCRRSRRTRARRRRISPNCGKGLTEALTKRDQEFGDYRTTKK